MRVLLIGDYSGLHLSLRNGLREIGHASLLVSTGDGSKALPADIQLGGSSTALVGALRRRLDPLSVARAVGSFDVAQTISALYFAGPGYPKKTINKLLRRTAPKFFLSASGGDSYFHRFGEMRHHAEYVNEVHRHGQSPQFKRNASDRLFQFNQEVADRADGIIPISYEHHTAYRSHPKVMSPIPMPVDTDRITPQITSQKHGRLKILHGVTRVGHKGSRIIGEALRVVSEKYPAFVDCKTVRGLTYKEFMQTVSECDVLIDQLYAHTLGLSGLLGMAQGKVVISGVSETGLAALGQDSSPAVDSSPSVSGVVEAIESLLQRRRQIPDICEASRSFIELHHDYRKVANQYVQHWTKSLPWQLDPRLDAV